MKKLLCGGASLMLLGLGMGVAQADENLMAFTYLADTIPQGGVEFNSTFTNRWDKGRGRYYAMDIDLELEYGITDRLQIAGYLNAQYINHKNAFPTAVGDTDPLYPDRQHTRWNGGKVQLKYNIFSPYTDWAGFTVFIEPQYRRHFKVDGAKTNQKEVELGFIFQKNFFDDKLIYAQNFVFAKERRVLLEDDGFVEHEREFYNTIGLSYRVAPGWYAGVETRHHMDVLKQEDGSYKKNQYSWYIGPTVHYADEKWRVTVGYMRQIKGNPEYAAGVMPVVDGVGSNLHLDENEKNELRIRVGYDF